MFKWLKWILWNYFAQFIVSSAYLVIQICRSQECTKNHKKEFLYPLSRTRTSYGVYFIAWKIWKSNVRSFPGHSLKWIKSVAITYRKRCQFHSFFQHNKRRGHNGVAGAFCLPRIFYVHITHGSYGEYYAWSNVRTMYNVLQNWELNQ